MKLNLGARNRKIPGYLGVDCDAHDGVDVVSDVSNLSFLDNGSISEIYASHVLEHFSHRRTDSVLKEWGRVLRNGGILRVAVPDFKRTVELCQRMGGLFPWAINFLWGDQEYDTAYHYTAFDERLLRGKLAEAGFTDISRVESFGLNKDDCSNLVSNIDRKSVSLNLVAIK